MSNSAWEDFEQEIKLVSLDELRTMRANVYTTFCGALGHNKAHMNEVRLSIIDNEFQDRGTKPNIDVEGEFNGIGSV